MGYYSITVNNILSTHLSSHPMADILKPIFKKITFEGNANLCRYFLHELQQNRKLPSEYGLLHFPVKQ